MAVILEGVEGPPRGKRIEVRPGKPVPFKVRRSDQDAGQVVVELLGGQCVLTNRSSQPCRINGEDRQRSVLRAGDRVEIGKNIFLVHIDEGDGGDTQALDGASRAQLELALADTNPQPPPPPAPPSQERLDGTCSVCDGPFHSPSGWKGPEARICRSCLEKGVRPEHLPRPMAAAPEPPDGLANAADRHARRISASRLSAIEPEERGGILHRVSTLLGHRADKQRLDQLQRERQELLAEAGRLSLGAQGALGLPEAALQALVSGERVTIEPQDVTRAVLDQWHSQRERIHVLDTEIAGVRRTLGLGPDPEAVLLPAPILRPEAKHRQEQAFATLDGVGTEMLAEDAANDVPATRVPTPAPAPVAGAKQSQSGIRRAAARRRR